MNENGQRAMLGAIFRGDCMPANLVPHDFSGSNATIFRRMTDLQDRGETIDRITVANELMKFNELESVGGLTYLVELSDAT
jgi:replicative DNA helicase